MATNKAGRWITLVAVLIVFGAGGWLAWLFHKDAGNTDLRAYERRREELVDKSIKSHLSDSEEAELAEVNRRIGKMKADQVGR